MVTWLCTRQRPGECNVEVLHIRAGVHGLWCQGFVPYFPMKANVPCIHKPLTTALPGTTPQADDRTHTHKHSPRKHYHCRTCHPGATTTLTGQGRRDGH